jgi:signal transduction histidine kinase
MTLRTRLTLGILAISLVLVAPLLVSVRALEGLHTSMEELRRVEFGASFLLGRMRGTIEELRNRELLLTVTSEERRAEAQVYASLDSLALMADSLRRYGLESMSQAVHANVRLVRDYVPRELAAATEDRRRNTDSADSLSTVVVRPAIAAMEAATREAEAQLRQHMSDRVDASSAASEEASRITNTVLIGGAILATIIAIWLTTSVSRPVRDLEDGMHRVADGDFDHRLAITPNRRDEFGRLAASYQSMASQLRQLDELKAEFVSVASHELKTPINVILGYLQLMQEDVYGPLTPKQREICLTLSGQAQSLSRLVRQLLDISRFEAGGGKLDLRPLRLSPFLSELESAFRVLALQRGIRFHVERGPGLPDSVTWDEDRMNEVLGNLLSNAFKFTDRGGVVELTVNAVEHAIEMTVHDTGAGIPGEQLPHIFEKFYQADNQASASSKGSGLGLAIAKGIVEAHGGSIDVQSRQTIGTTFKIRMPSAAQRQTAHLLAPMESEVGVS